MPGTRQQRRLAAVLIADVVGYSRLMEADELRTLQRLKAVRAEVISPRVLEFGGHVVKTTGDGTLIEFPSALDAVACAQQIQKTVARREAEAADPADALRFRIGLHLGDIIVDNDDIFGDGVNIAARLEAMAPPGGIAISGSIHEQIVGKLDTVFTELGDRQMKNISRPVHVWTWQPESEAGGDTAELPELGASDANARRGKMPVVAVLRFTAAGNDPEVGDLADSLADDLTTAFAGRRGIDVVGRAATARLDGPAHDLGAVRQATGAEYVLTGALRRSGGRLRVTAELIETDSGSQLWTSRYDRDWGDIFSLGDDLTESIAIAARTAMNAYAGHRYSNQPDDSLTNAERRAKAAQHFYKFTRADFERAGQLLDQVLADDPEDAMALSMRAFALMYHDNFDARRPDETIRQRALDMASRAVQLDRASDYGYQIRGLLQLHLRGDCDAALLDAEQSLALSPQYGLAIQLKGEALNYGGRPDEGIPLIRRLIEIDPRDPINYLRHWLLAMGHFAAGDDAATLSAIQRSREGVMNNPLQDLVLVAALQRLGRTEEAHAEVEALLNRWPDATVSTVKLPPYKRPEDRARFREALRAAGLPEG